MKRDHWRRHIASGTRPRPPRRSPSTWTPYPDPDPVTCALALGGLRARAAIERRMPPRRTPRHVRELRDFRIYPHGYSVDQLGTFPVTSPHASFGRVAD